MSKLLTVDAAAEYIGVGVQKLKQLAIPRRRVHTGQKGLRYYTVDLDKWLDSLPKEGEHVQTKTDWLAQLDAAHQT